MCVSHGGPTAALFRKLTGELAAPMVRFTGLFIYVKKEEGEAAVRVGAAGAGVAGAAAAAGGGVSPPVEGVEGGRWAAPVAGDDAHLDLVAGATRDGPSSAAEQEAAGQTVEAAPPGPCGGSYTGPDSDYVNKYYGSEGRDLSWSGGEEEDQDDNCPQWP